MSAVSFVPATDFHATRRHNRLAGDADKRNRLRAEGRAVFQLTWDDLDAFERQTNTAESSAEREPAEPVWPPYPRSAQDVAKQLYAERGGDDLATTIEWGRTVRVFRGDDIDARPDH